MIASRQAWSVGGEFVAGTTTLSRASAQSRARPALSVAIVAVIAAYLVQALSPLRVDYDSTEYLLLAAWISDRGGFPDGASFPPGLPTLIAGLDTVGAGHSWGIVLMNTAFVALGLGSLALLLRRDLGGAEQGVLGHGAGGTALVPLMRWTAQPLSEAAFFGLSFAGSHWPRRRGDARGSGRSCRRRSWCWPRSRYGRSASRSSRR